MTLSTIAHISVSLKNMKYPPPRESAAFVSLTLVLAFVIYLLFSGKPFLAASSALAALVMLRVLLMGLETLEDEITKAVAPIAMILGLMHVFSTSHAIEFDNHKQHPRILTAAVQADYCPYQTQPDELKRSQYRKLGELVVLQCATQHYQDAADLAMNASKVIYLDPVSGFADSVYSELFGSKRVTCIDVAKKMNELCPGALKL